MLALRTMRIFAAKMLLPIFVGSTLVTLHILCRIALRRALERYGLAITTIELCGLPRDSGVRLDAIQ